MKEPELKEYCLKIGIDLPASSDSTIQIMQVLFSHLEKFDAEVETANVQHANKTQIPSREPDEKPLSAIFDSNTFFGKSQRAAKKGKKEPLPLMLNMFGQGKKERQQHEKTEKHYVPIEGVESGKKSNKVLQDIMDKYGSTSAPSNLNSLDWDGEEPGEYG